MKQSPIEWMEDQLKQVLPINQMNDIVIQDLFKKAKEKEQQVIDKKYIQGAKDYCKSSDGIDTFITKFKQNDK